MSGTIATVGYESERIDDFVARLVSEGVEQILDVRELPLSRKRGFSKNALSAALAAVGISYVHLKPLGDPKQGRDAARAGRIDEFQQIFSKHMQSEEAKKALGIAASLAKTQRSALLCFEKEHTNCHRAIVADALRLVYGFEVEHIPHTAVITDGATAGRNRGCACESYPSNRQQAR